MKLLISLRLALVLPVLSVCLSVFQSVFRVSDMLVYILEYVYL